MPQTRDVRDEMVIPALRARNRRLRALCLWSVIAMFLAFAGMASLVDIRITAAWFALTAVAVPFLAIRGGTR